MMPPINQIWMFLRHRKVALIFYGGLILLTFLTIATSVVSLISFRESNQSTNLLVQSIQAVSTAARLTNLTESIEAQGVFLVTADSNPTRETARYGLEDQITLLRAQLAQFYRASEKSPEINDRVAALQQLIDRLSAVVDDLDTTVSAHLVEKKALRDQVAKATKLTEKVTLFQAPTIELVADLSTWRSNLALALALAIAESRDPFGLKQREQLASHRLKLAEATLNEMGALATSDLEKLHDEVAATIFGASGLFAARTNTFNLEQSVSGRLSITQKLARDLNAGTNGLVDLISRVGAETAATASSAQEKREKLLFWTVFSAIALAVGSFIFIQRTVFARLLQLQRVMSRQVTAEVPRIAQSGDDEINQMARAFQVFVDKRQQAEAEIIKARELAERANQDKTRFLAAASHDLRQPLQAATLFVASLLQQESDPTKRENLGYLNQSIDALRQLIDAILEISRLESGAVRPTIETVDGQILLRRLNAEFTLLAKQKGLKLVVHANPIHLRTDAHMLERILRNLLDNALKYTQEGSIHLIMEPRDSQVMLEVGDTGVGIVEAEQEKIFAEFHQVDNTSRDRGQGLGLGLSIVKRLTTLLDIPMELSSAPGQGSRFRIFVPRADGTPARKSHAMPDRPVGEMLGQKVLVIDDDKAVLEASRRLLSSWGLDVHASADPREDSDEYRTMIEECAEAPAVVIADYRLPHDMTGIQVIDRLRRHYQEALPAVLITGEVAPESMEDARNFDGPLLRKPVDTEKLKHILGSIISERTATAAD